MSVAASTPHVIKTTGSVSPFASLLRRSKFVSFDPAIKQTYYSPPSHAHRGDYGLKRPVPLTRKNAFITLNNFDEHHNYTDWRSGENQVRFVRRWEEFNAHATTNERSSWAREAGEIKRVWAVDSEFEHPQEDAESSKYEFKMFTQSASPATLYAETISSQIPSRGPGQYGRNRPTMPQKGWDARQSSIYDSVTTPAQNLALSGSDQDISKRFLLPNINSMTTRQFRGYLKRLRTLRPQFKQHINEFIKASGSTPNNSAHLDSASNLGTVGMGRPGLAFKLQNLFLNRVFSQSVHRPITQPNAKPRIMPQPHPNAGLSYAHPSRLQTHLGTQYVVSKFFPGYILNPSERINSDSVDPISNAQRNKKQTTFGGFSGKNVVAVGGVMGVSMIKGNQTMLDKTSLFRPHRSTADGGGMMPITKTPPDLSPEEKEEIQNTLLENSTGEFRISNEGASLALLESAPNVVGYDGWTPKYKAGAWDEEKEHQKHGLGPVSLRVEFTPREVDDKLSFSLDSGRKYWPGSRGYIGNADRPETGLPRTRDSLDNVGALADALSSSTKNRKKVPWTSSVQRTPQPAKQQNVDMLKRLGQLAGNHEDLG